MRILVTGAAGFIGSHLCEALLAHGHSVIALDSYDEYLYPASIKHKNAAALQRALDPQRFRLVTGDICDAAQVAAVLTPEIDVVCHLAALAGVRPSIQEPERYIRTNLLGTTVILERMQQLGKQRLVFASSSSVYGARNPPPGRDVIAFHEDDPCLQPASPYAATKRAGELLCSTYRDLYGIGVTNLRFFTVYGPRQRPDMAIHKFVAAIAAEKEVTLFGDGSSRRDYTYIDDIVAGTLASCERVQPGDFNIYNLGGTRTTSLAELISCIEKIVGKAALVHRMPDQPGDVPITCADITRAKKALGYSPGTDLATGIGHFWTWFQESRR